MQPSALDVLYYLDETTGQPRGSAPTANGRALDAWDAGLRNFLATLPPVAGEVVVSDALGRLRRPGRNEVGHFAVGYVIDTEGRQAVFSLHGSRHGVNLWEQVGTTQARVRVGGAGDLQPVVRPLPDDSPRVFWWAAEGDYTSYRRIKFTSAP